jgi:2-polyprenyl-3-methyl-5-hydroxy-6-metoxy-1,4-benzoquinol methylase
VDEHLAVNRANWDERVAAHVASPDYAVERFAEDPEFLSGVVRFDLPRLPVLNGKDGVHLQCHIGTDTVSLARLGARMTGLDFSEPAIEAARRVATAAGVEAQFHVAEVYDAPDVLGRNRFDLIYTGIGALIWLPDIRRWAAVVAALLRPGGELFIREGHPMLWTLEDERTDGLLVVHHPYFEQPEPTVFEIGGTYVQTDQVFETTTSHEWSHALSQIVGALLDENLELTLFEEHDSIPWNGLPGQMEEIGGGEWRLIDRPERLPASYTLRARLRP